MNTKELDNLQKNLDKYKNEIFRPEFRDAWYKHMAELILIAREAENERSMRAMFEIPAWALEDK